MIAFLKNCVGLFSGVFFVLFCFCFFLIIPLFKDTLKAFDNFKNKQRKCMK